MFSDIKSRLADLTNCIGRQEVPEVEANEGTMVDKPAPQKAMTADQMKKLLPDIRDAERISEALGWRMRQCERQP